MTDVQVLTRPRWTQRAERKQMLEILFRSDALDRAVWRLLFEPGHTENAFRLIGDREFLTVYSWEVDWTRQLINYSFNDKPNSLVTVEPLQSMRTLSRSFPVQNDSFLCAIHSLNTIARGILLNPVSIFDTIVSMRQDAGPDTPISLYAQREEVVIAALKEGVVLGSVLLNEPGHFAALCDVESDLPLDENKVVEQAAIAAGGLMLLFSSGRGYGGHFVSIVLLEQNLWALYDTASVVTIQKHLGDVLRCACRMRMNDNDREVVGLIPLTRGVTRVIDLWSKSVVRNLTAAKSSNSISINVPIYTPFHLHGAAVSITEKPEEFVDALSINPFTFYTACLWFEDEMNDKAEEVAQCLVTCDDDHAFHVNWESEQYKHKLENLSQNLIQLSSLIRSRLGILFAPRSILSNRDWLRYVVAHHVARLLGRAVAADPHSTRLYRTAMALAVLTFSWHKNAGEKIDEVNKKFVAIYAIYKIAARRNFFELFGSIDPQSTFARRSVADMNQEELPHHYLGRNRLDRAVWLLHAAKYSIGNIGLDQTALAALDSGVRDTGKNGGDAVASLDLLRDVAFATPDFEESFQMTQSARLQIAGSNVPLATRRRELLLPKFRDCISRLRQNDGALCLFWLFGLSSAYETWNGSDTLKKIDEEADRLPHLIEQAIVQQGGESMFGVVYDAQQTLAPSFMNLALLTKRFVYTATNGRGNPANYSVRNECLMPIRPFVIAREDSTDENNSYKKRRLEDGSD